MAELDFSAELKEISATFIQYRNDILIFTEDNDADKEFYVQFYQCLLEGTDIRLNDVTQLGSCREVEAAYLRETDFTTPKLYVVDGDIQLLYSPKEEKPNLFPLHRYCIENYLINENALVETLYLFLGKFKKEKIKELLAYDTSMNRMAQKIIPLFYYFSILTEYDLPFTLSSVHRYFQGTFLDNEIQKAKREMHRILLDSGLCEEKIQEKLLDRKSRFPLTTDSLMIVVCGKDYILEYVKSLVKNNMGVKNLNIPQEAWKLNCCRNLDIVPLMPLRDKIVQICHSIPVASVQQAV